jgi:beta-lactamase superfamily II metal-dependent hydrolase
MPPLQVHFIDVGQGDSILVNLGETEVLIDGGDESPSVVEYLSSHVDGSLEVMVASHPHADHIGGLIAVLDAFEVDEIWHNGDRTTSKTYADFMAAVQAEGAEVHIARLGDGIQAGELGFIVLHPSNLHGTTNNNSIVLSLKYGGIDFLFTGDAEQEAEGDVLVQSVVPLPDVEILKVGHHASRSSSSATFLQLVQPEVAIYMAGEGNSYGHPHYETTAALNTIGAGVYGTDVNGTIVVVTDGFGYGIQLERYAPPRAPPATPTPLLTPSPTPTPTPTLTPTPITTPAAKLSLKIVSVTSPVGRGYTATLLARTEPGAYCTITVYYKSGPSKASGLYEKQADSQGNVSWSWKVGTRTTPGSWRIVVTASLGGERISETTYFTVR